MWFTEERRVDWSEAERVLSRGDPVMRKLIRRVGPCTLAPRRDYFVKLCQSIFAQQLSTNVWPEAKTGLDRSDGGAHAIPAWRWNT